VTVTGNGHIAKSVQINGGGTSVKLRVTIRDVATAAGVSHQTVSRVINNRPDVADETRRRVWKVINELNYQPSAIARSLIRQRSFTLGVVTAGLKYVGPSRTLSGITEAAEEMGYTLVLKELPRFDTNDIQPLLNSLMGRQVDGIIWAVPEIGTNRAWLEGQPPALAAPLIFLTMRARPALSSVSIDNYRGGCLATEHLLAQGYQYIGHISGPLDWWEARQRMAGWQDTLRQAGRPVADHHWASGNWSAASGEKAISPLLDAYPEMDALFVANDQMALAVLQVACRRGLRIPQDLAVVGFDGIPEAGYYWPPLTTVYQDLRELGCTAVRQLSWAIEASHQQEAPVGSVALSIQPELIVRESSAARGPEVAEFED
jgi:LacI family transcriptional regulator